MKLTNIQCKNVKPTDKPQKLADGGGMFLHIMPTGQKYWRLKYRFNDKEKLLALGVYPRISLAEARERREEAKKLLDIGKDPVETKKLEKLVRQTEYENNFENLAREWHKERIHSWKPLHAERILKRLEADIFPKIGSRPIKAIIVPELLAAFKAVEARGSRDLAHRMMQMTSQIFRYAVATGRVERDMTTDLRGALQPVKSVGYTQANR